jgi:hypothetical protein
MSTTELFIEALSLPVRERAELVHRLLSSLEQVEITPEIEAAWKTEALERSNAFDRGELTERDATDVFGAAYAKLE